MGQGRLQNEAWVRQMADLEDQHMSVGAGGRLSYEGGVAPLPLAYESDFKERVGQEAVSRLMKFLRRRLGVTLVELSTDTDIALEDLISVETDGDPERLIDGKILTSLSKYYGMPEDGVLKLLALSNVENDELYRAAAKFLAQTSNNSILTELEETSYLEICEALSKS